MTNDLNRFVEAQGGVLQLALDELKSGRKRSHWMWFIFPQLYGLGHSEHSKKYGVHGLREAEAYLAHPVLGPRLKQATNTVLNCKTHPREVFGEIDYQKFVSCMTLFMLTSPVDSLFASVLRSLSTIDKKTQEILRGNHDDL